MSVVAVLGAGAGGLSALVELQAAGHRVQLWNRSAATLARNVPDGEVRYAGVLGTGTVRPDLVTTELPTALAGADLVLVALPATVHEQVFVDLAAARCARPVVLNPGHPGGALHARMVFVRAGVPVPPIAELSTLTYVGRVDPDGLVRTTGRASGVRGAALPGGASALEGARELFPQVDPVADVLFTSLSDVNLVLHPPGAVLGAAWVEATGGRFTFYREAMTDGVVRVLQALDAERLAVGAAFGHTLLPLGAEMALIGTVDATAAAGDIGAAIRQGEANATIVAPDSFGHRYYREDVPFGLVPFLALARVAGVAVPVARSLMTLAQTAVGDLPTGRSAARMGIVDLGVPEVLDLVGGVRA
ncbi:MAG: NAD/NADP octopine/nopaline dehydrogenase family protein [Actinobacteria bacterium]|nr:NAD/NADP octopine/nopaline dehydrogenase family protein [Actinomycetota bacterium]